MKKRFWTLEDAATAIQQQEEWAAFVSRVLFGQMLKAANSGDLVIRSPKTGRPCKPSAALRMAVVVSPADVNAWLESQGTSYLWNA